MKRKLLFVSLLFIAGFLARNYAQNYDFTGGSGLFYKKTSASTVKVVTERENYPYYSNLPTGHITIPASVSYGGVTYQVTDITGNSFSSCPGITKLTLSSGLLHIHSSAFQSCSGLASVEFPPTLRSIGAYAFYGCANITALNLPASLYHLGAFSFSGAKLDSIHVAPGSQYLKSVDGVLYSRDGSIVYLYPRNRKDESYRVRPGVKILKAGAFAGNESLKNIHLPEGLEYIGFDAFHMCKGIRTIRIPASIASIANGALRYIPNLQEVIVARTVPAAVDTNAFYGLNLAGMILRVPSGTLLAYQNAEVWKDFGFITDGSSSPNLTVNPMELNFRYQGGSQNLNITANSAWRIAYHPSWITLAIRQGRGNASVSIAVQKNVSTDSRQAVLKVLGVAGKEIRITVKQSPEPTLKVSPMELEAAPAGGTRNIQIASNSAWKITSSVPWCRASQVTGNGNATVNFTFDANNGTATRIGMAHVEVDNITRIVNLRQDPYQLTVQPNKLTIAAEGASKDIDIKSNTHWKAESAASWIKPATSSGSDNTKLKVTVAPNPTVENRSDTLFVKAGKLVRPIVVVQAGTSATLSVHPDQLTIASDGASKSISVTSNTGWILHTPAGWMKTSIASGSGNATFKLTVAPNPTVESRSDTLFVKAGKLVKPIAVVQAGASATLSLHPAKLKISAKGEVKIVDVKSNTNWSAETDADWLRLSASSGANNAKLTITVQANPKHVVRNAVVTLKAASLIRSITVMQDAATSLFDMQALGLRFWSDQGVLYIDSDTCLEEDVCIYNLSGLLLSRLKLSEDLKAQIALPMGMYVVRVGNRVAKVVVN